MQITPNQCVIITANCQLFTAYCTSTLEESLLATGFPYYDYEWMAAYMKAFQYFLLNTRGIRRCGAAAVDLAYVACGRFDAFFEYSLNSWDVAAGALIIQEAGGKVTDFKGEDNFLHGKQLMAGNPKVFEKIGEVIKKHFSLNPTKI